MCGDDLAEVDADGSAAQPVNDDITDASGDVDQDDACRLGQRDHTPMGTPRVECSIAVLCCKNLPLTPAEHHEINWYHPVQVIVQICRLPAYMLEARQEERATRPKILVCNLPANGHRVGRMLFGRLQVIPFQGECAEAEPCPPRPGLSGATASRPPATARVPVWPQ